MDIITWQIAELVYNVVFITWLVYHGFESIWFIVTRKPSYEMDEFIHRYLKAFCAYMNFKIKDQNKEQICPICKTNLQEIEKTNCDYRNKKVENIESKSSSLNRTKI